MSNQSNTGKNCRDREETKTYRCTVCGDLLDESEDPQLTMKHAVYDHPDESEIGFEVARR